MANTPVATIKGTPYFSIRRARGRTAVLATVDRPVTHAVVLHQEVVTMVPGAIVSEHRTWGDWVAISVGVLIGLTPWFAGVPENPALVLNSALVGVVVWGCP